MIYLNSGNFILWFVKFDDLLNYLVYAKCFTSIYDSIQIYIVETQQDKSSGEIASSSLVHVLWFSFMVLHI